MGHSDGRDVLFDSCRFKLMNDEVSENYLKFIIVFKFPCYKHMSPAVLIVWFL